jgi:hypothetical protein
MVRKGSSVRVRQRACPILREPLGALLGGDAVGGLSRRPDGRCIEASIEQVAISADDRVDALLDCQCDEIVVLAVTRRRRGIHRILNDRDVAPDTLDVLSPRPLVGIPSELRPSQHALQLGQQQRARDNDDPLIDERPSGAPPRAPISAEMKTPGSTTTRITPRRARGAQREAPRRPSAQPPPRRDPTAPG